MENFGKSILFRVAALFLALVAVQNASAAPWVNTGGLNLARNSHTATLLPNGLVLVTGGISTTIVAKAELYNPVTESWFATRSLHAPRQLHTATLLRNGEVLIAAGKSTNGVDTASAELGVRVAQ